MQLELREHPAKTKCPETGELVCKCPDQRGVFVDGVLAGYCGDRPGTPLSLIRWFPEHQRERIVAFVEAELGARNACGMVPKPEEPEATGDDWEE